MKKAKITDKKLVIAILVSAFLPLHENSSINLVVKQDKKRTKRMYILMEYLFETTFYFGEIFISDDDKSCILLKYSDKEKITPKLVFLNLKLAIKCISIERVLTVLKRQQTANKNYPKEKHIKPMLIGVKNEYKGTGAAARFMLEIKNKFKNNPLPIIIDTTSLQNVRLYQKFGFRIIKEENSFGFPIYFLRLN